MIKPSIPLCFAVVIALDHWQGFVWSFTISFFISFKTLRVSIVYLSSIGLTSLCASLTMPADCGRALALLG